MWLDRTPVDRNWQGGPINVTDVLYEFDGPVIFRAKVGFNDFLFAKRDEGEDFDFFLAVETADNVVDALRSGRISLRGALYRDEGWLIETDLNRVNGFQHLNEDNVPNFLPANNVGLLNRFGEVPDTIEQAEAFISFRFLGASVSRGRVPLTVLQEKVNHFSSFVRRALTPPTLNNGRDYRFFDVQMAEPRFTSLVLAATKPQFNVKAIENSRRLRGVDPEQLVAEAGEQGRTFWSSLEFAADQIKSSGRLSDEFVANEHVFLQNIEGLVPSSSEGLERVEITFNDGAILRTAIIDREAGDQILEAQERLQRSNVRTIVGVITEVNGDSGTFIIKDLGGRQTTCDMPADDFDNLDDNGALRRGRQVSVTGSFTRRTRRDHIWIEEAIRFLN